MYHDENGGQSGPPAALADVGPTSVPAPQPILTRPMILLLITSIGSLGSFYLLMPVVPLLAAAGGAGGVGAGLATGAMMLGTVLMEFAVPALLGRYGYRAVMALGLFLLGAPAIALTASQSLPLVLGVCLVRGAGLGIVVVAGAALIAELVPAERRGEGLGLYGVAVGVPSIACLPLGLWLNANIGHRPVLVTGAALSLLALAAVHGLPGRSARVEPHGSVLGALRIDGLAGPAVVFAAVTLAAGVLLTFLPLALSASDHLAATALLAQSCATPLARWFAGRYADRHGSTRLLVPAVLFAALGTAALIWVDEPLAVIAGMGLFGIGFGVAQNVTLAVMFERVREADFGRVSALWNLAYDGGMGVGAVGFGLVAGPVGYPMGFALTAVVLCAALAPAWRDQRRNSGLIEATPPTRTAPLVA
ncbi:MFS transporter [Actinomadura sp. HBU206391]|uniref:MFS transporter n=1 Tax=Actinomadura sp. HBU206391 TaxID=2731692 RepID=UPI00164F2AD3|nr:MFS transporter [Actinomadura sp. HBU206391]MBC6457187.1 MFS transporter [Actinomadura sp. HBU206391]